MSRSHLVAVLLVFSAERMAMVSGGAALALVFSRRALAGLPLPLLEINHDSR